MLRDSVESFFLVPEAVEQESTVLLDAGKNVILREV